MRYVKDEYCNHLSVGTDQKVFMILSLGGLANRILTTQDDRFINYPC